MIDFIEGRVEYTESDSVILGTSQGVGYRIFCPNPYIYRVTETKRVFTHHHVREDAAYLFGFATRDERNLFRKLIDVSGIGPKGALAILAAATPPQIVAAVQREDVGFLTKFPGIGKKTAGRIVLDLKDKLKEFAKAASIEEIDTEWNEGLFGVDQDEAPSSPHVEASEALKALGYSDAEVQKVMGKLQGEKASTEELIKKALQLFISSK